ncbi:MAG: RNA 2',3'-cyclic phosphodiesterase [Thermoplasmatales archaeon]|nr:MAG: RNA 2',3'-cyclic phosphodiesterase [Thermoplasmatales archaeon]
MSQFRGFIAIEINAFKKLIEFEKEIKKTYADVKIVEPENIHITLKFLGNTDESKTDQIEEIIKDAVKEVKPFKIRLKGTGVFPNKSYMKVIWVGIENGDKIILIANEINEKLVEIGFEKEKRKFSAHLTIARVRSAKNKERLLQKIQKYECVEFGDMEVKSVTLKNSDLTPKGPIYTTLKEIKL